MNYTQDEIAQGIIAEGRARGLDDLGIVCGIACGLVESELTMYANEDDPETLNFPYDELGSDSLSSGVFQQQPPWWGTVADRMDVRRSAGMFFAELHKQNYRDDPGEAIANVQQPRADLRWKYGARMDDAWQIFNRLSGGNTVAGFTGDPDWLEDVLRAALGDRLHVEDGWADRGVGGTMGDIWGVMIHHTGNSRETVELIRDGRSDLAGPLSQCLIKPDGAVWLVAVGPCNHAGAGSYPGIPTDGGNQVLIGFECAWPDIAPDGSYDEAQLWPDAQIISMRDATSAVLARLGYGADRVIGHKEYAGARQGKWDPGNLDMGWFRGEVAKDLRGEFDSQAPQQPPASSVPAPPPILPKPGNGRSDRVLLEEVWDQLRGPTGEGWDVLGGRTPVEALRDVLADVSALRTEVAALKKKTTKAAKAS